MVAETTVPAQGPGASVTLDYTGYLMFATPANRSAAVRTCAAANGTLAAAHSAAQAALLRELCWQAVASAAGYNSGGELCWLGLTAPASSAGDPDAWAWPDGSPAVLAAWEPDQPVTGESNDHMCGALVASTESSASSSWRSMPCQQELPFLCMALGAAPAAAGDAGLPGDASLLLDGAAFALFTQPTAFQPADAACAALGGSLAVIHSALESALMMSLCSEAGSAAHTTGCWVGLSAPEGSNMSDPTSWAWLAGGAPGTYYTAWADGQPMASSAMNTSGCAIMRAAPSAGSAAPLYATPCNTSAPYLCRLEGAAAAAAFGLDAADARLGVQIQAESCTSPPMPCKYMTKYACMSGYAV